MNLLIFGATGEIGEAVLQIAVSAGHDVTAFVRSRDKLGEARNQVKVVEGDLTDAAALASALNDTDAVISAIGSNPDKAQLDAPATAVRLILAAMGSAGVRRFVGLAGGAVNVPGEWKPLSGRISSALVRLLARNVVEAKQREFEVVSRSDLDWTMVRPPRVVAGEPTGRVEIGPKLHGFQVTRGDLATAMVTLATGSDWLRQAPYVSEARQR